MCLVPCTCVEILSCRDAAMIPANINLENPLWDFALKVYPSLAQTLLALQSKGARVNQLLAALWCSDMGLAWPGEIAPEIEVWHQQRVLPVRGWRMELKPLLAEQPQLETLYNSYKRVELSAEQIELGLLYRWLASESSITPAYAKDEATNAGSFRRSFISVEENIRKVLSANQVKDFDAELSQLLDQMQRFN